MAAESRTFLHGLSTRDAVSRKKTLDSITETIESWTDVGCGSAKNALESQLPVLLKLAHRCPFDDVKDRCRSILDELKSRDVDLLMPHLFAKGPSNFIPEDKVVPVNTDEETHMLFVDAFIQNNRLDHLTQVIGYHPQYLDCFLRTQNHLLHGDGPLPFEVRHYIAIMAAGRHRCSYLIDLHAEEFIMQGGDHTWLKGLNFIPPKLRDLYEINKILAHRPWLIQKSHIEKLTKGSNNWSVSEVMQAIILLAHFHVLAGFVHAAGVNPEIDLVGGHTYHPESTNYEGQDNVPNNGGANANNLAGEGGINALMERMKQLTKESKEETTQEEMLKRFETVENPKLDLTTDIFTSEADILRYIEEPDFVYQDFTRAACFSDLPTFRARDYSWEEQGFSLANRLYPDIGNLLDEKFRVAYNLTYYTMGNNTDVDTSSFRQAIWNYIHCIYGIRHDDYNYAEVNQLLERNLKAYIKTVTCYPERIRKKDYDNVMQEFKHSEKMHVSLMIFEARMQAVLLYALRAVMRYMT